MPNKTPLTTEDVTQQVQRHFQMMQHLCGNAPAATREGRMRQEMYADATVLVTLKTVRELLPAEVQTVLDQVLSLHESVCRMPEK